MAENSSGRTGRPNRYLPLVTAICRAQGWPEPEAEVCLIPGRRFRCDLVWRAARLVVEVQGGVWGRRGGHTGGQAQIDDMEKLNLLQLAGFTVLQVTPRQVVNGALTSLLAGTIGSAVWR